MTTKQATEQHLRQSSSLLVSDIQISRVASRLLSISVVRILIDISYILYIQPIHAYQYGFRFAYDPESLLLSWALLVSFALIASIDLKERLSDLVINILFMVSFVPTTTIIAYHGVEGEFVLVFSVYWAILLIAKKLAPIIPTPTINGKTRKGATWVATAVVVATALVISYSLTGFRVTIDLFSAYELREEAADALLPGALSSLFYFAKTAIPILAINHLEKKSYLSAALLCFCQLLLFSFDGSKSALFSLALALILYLFVKRVTFDRVLICMVVFVALSLVEKVCFGTVYLLNFAVRRLFCVPAVLNTYYYEFFSVNPIDYYRQSVFSKLGIDSAYDVPIANLIGMNYLGSDSYANNGMFADAFANLGIIGLIVMPICIVLVLRLLDSFSKGLSLAATAPLAVVAAFTFLSSSFFTVLITHGLLLDIVLVLFLVRKEGARYDE